MRLAVLLLLVVRPALAARLCARVSVLGRPLPRGLATLRSDRAAAKPGTTERSLAPLRDGRVCFEGVAAGAYRVEIAPLGWKDPMPLERDAVVVPDAGTQAELAYAAPAPDGSWVNVKGRVRYPSAGAWSREPALLMIQTHDFQSISDTFPSFAWVAPGAPGATVPFELRVRPGDLRNVFLESRDLAVAQTDPSTHTRRQNHSLAFHEAEDFPFRLDAGRVARVVRGRVTVGGKPFRPDLGADVERRAWCELRVLKLGGGQQFYLTTDDEGRFSIPLPAGPWGVVLWVYYKDGLYLNSFKTGPMRLLRIAPGRGEDLVLDFDVPGEAALKLAPDLLEAGAPKERGTVLYPQHRRSMFALPPGSLDAFGSYRLFVENLVTVHLTQGHDLRWKRNFYDADQGAEHAFRAAAGRYDLYFFDEDESSQPYLVMRALRRGVELRAGAESSPALEPADRFPEGTAELRGTIKASLRVGAAELSRIDDLAALGLIAAPYVNFYDAGGRLAGVAAAEVPKTRHDRLIADVSELRSTLYAGPRAIRIAGLAPGRYRAQAVAYGYPPREFTVDLSSGAPARLDVDMDK